MMTIFSPTYFPHGSNEEQMATIMAQLDPPALKEARVEDLMANLFLSGVFLPLALSVCLSFSLYIYLSVSNGLPLSFLVFVFYSLSPCLFLDTASQLYKRICVSVRPLLIQKNPTSDAFYCPPGLISSVPGSMTRQ